MIDYKQACKLLWDYVDEKGGIPEDEDIIVAYEYQNSWSFYFGVPNGLVTAGRFFDYIVYKDTGLVDVDYLDKAGSELQEYYDRWGKKQKVKWGTVPCYFTKKPDITTNNN